MRTERVSELEEDKGGLGAQDCRAQLDRILQSADFQIPERGRRFLTYIVEETLAGRADRIKAYSVATHVFGRSASFDPKIDPIVRVEAGQLRKALDRYYLSAGNSDPILISIPKGHYVPQFSRRKSLPVKSESLDVQTDGKPPWLTAVASRMWLAALAAVVAVGVLALFTFKSREVEGRDRPAIPRLLIVTFEDISASAGPDVVKGLTHEIISQLAKFRDLVVLQRDSLDAFNKETQSSPNFAPRFILTGTAVVTKERLRVQAELTDRLEGTVIWANSYEDDLQASKLMEIEGKIASAVATTIAQPYGVIFQADANRHVEPAPEDWTAYACTLFYFQYRANLDPQTHAPVRKCLEQTVERFPAYSTAWALLSQTYIDELRFRFPAESTKSPASIERATDAARRALELDPTNVRAQQAMMFALYFTRQFDAALKMGEQALSTNPNDTELMGEYGYRLALSGSWAKGCPLLDEARHRNPGPLGYYETAIALCRYYFNDYKSAAEWMKKSASMKNPNFHFIAAGIFAEAGMMTDAARERDWLQANAPQLVGNLRKEVEFRLGRKEDAEKFIASLRKAGLEVP